MTAHASPATPIRRQLTLFIPGAVAAHVESVRRIMDPLQHRRIRAHVTLCRDAELEALAPEALQERLHAARPGPLTLRFGPPERFEGHGMLLGCTAGHADYKRLREVLLGHGLERLERPHITLAHPRNPKAPGNLLANASILEHGISVTFRTVSLVEQQDGGAWAELAGWALA